MSVPRQLALNLPARAALGRDSFYVSEANRLALAQIDAWPDWPSGRLAIAGPPGSGKTHLAHVWAARSGATLVPAEGLAAGDVMDWPEDAAVGVEDADALSTLARGKRVAAEEALFHLANRLTAGGGSLLVTGVEPPARWQIRLRDLGSRLRVASVARLDPPDDALLSAVLLKLFIDRQLTVEPDLIRYLVSRMDRSLAAAADLVARLDETALAQRRPVTQRLAAEVLRSDG